MMWPVLETIAILNARRNAHPVDPICHNLAPIRSDKDRLAPEPCCHCNGCAWDDEKAWCNVIGGGKWGDANCEFYR